jgi:hypothetical protein
MGATISKSFKNKSKKIRNTARSILRPSWRANSFWASRKVKNAAKHVHSLNNAHPSQLRIRNPNPAFLTLRHKRRRTTRKN